MLLLLLITIISGGATLAQEERFTIGWLSFFPPDVFKAKMVELGYVEGENIAYLVPSYENVAPEDYFESYRTQLQAMIDGG